MRWARVAFGLLLGALILGGVALWGANRFLTDYLAAPGPLAAERDVVLPQGTGLSGIGRLLAENGVIGDATVFTMAARWTGQDRSLKAGEYRFPAGATPTQILDLLASGRVLQHRITVPEGLSVVEVMAILMASPVLEGELPGMPAEGSLLPETWAVVRGEQRARLVERMRKAMSDTLAELWPGRDPDLPLHTPEEALILASLVERETPLAGEHAKVAAVFVNRLRRGMRLQSDPTAAYGVTQGQRPLGREITRADLDQENAWNTYKIAGLPRTPIANPGRAAIAAVLHPADVDYLYFVADGTGGHAFSTTLAEHNRNVARWRRLQRDGGGAQGG